MIVLGICDGHDSGACLLQDGEILHAVSAERLTRCKRQPGFPQYAIQECLHSTGIPWEDIDLVAVAEKAGRAAFRVLDSWYRRTDPNQPMLRPTNRLARAYHRAANATAWTRNLDESISGSALKSRLEKIGCRRPLVFIEHHLAHLASALMWSGMKAPLVMSIDAYGDGSSGAAATYDTAAGTWKVLERFSMDRSPAQFFGAVASLLGFPEGEEGKVSALAPKAAADKPLEMLHDAMGLQGIISVHHLVPVAGRILKEFGRNALAAAAQAVIEESITGQVTGLMKAAGVDELAIAGGVFANVGVNGALSRIPGLKDLFVFPHMGDGGLCAGAAAAAMLQRGVQLQPRLKHVFLGAGFEQDQIDGAIGESGLKLAKTKDNLERVSVMLDDGKVIGMFRGKAEFGPRALGHRSILFSARDPELPAKVSRMIQRDPVMPFAPATRSGDFGSLYDAGPAMNCAPFMTAAFAARDAALEHAPTGVHADNTSRAQLVESDLLPELHALLDTQPAGTLINTSFNMHKEPIVHTPQDALRTFAESGIDALWMGDSLVVRQ